MTLETLAKANELKKGIDALNESLADLEKAKQLTDTNALALVYYDSTGERSILDLQGFTKDSVLDFLDKKEHLLRLELESFIKVLGAL